jgi:hypothetical protein
LCASCDCTTFGVYVEREDLPICQYVCFDRKEGYRTSLHTFQDIGPSDTENEKAKTYTVNTEITPPAVIFASPSWLAGGILLTKYAKMSMQTPQSEEPSRSQNLFPLILTKTNMNAIADRSLTTPNTPVKKRDEETEVKPADMKITGASNALS